MAETPRINPEYDPSPLVGESVVDLQKADPRLMSPEAARALLAAQAAYEIKDEQLPDINEQCRIYFLAVGEKIHEARDDRLNQAAA